MQFKLKEKIWVSSLSAVTVLIACWLFNPFPLYFLNDDLIHIPLSKEGVLLQRNSLRPFGDWSVQMDYFFWGKNAAGYHLTNLLLHAGNTLLVYFLSNTLLEKYAATKSYHWQSIMVATLFFAYAFHSETIFWILGRSGSLGTLFFIPALLFFLKRFQRSMYFIMSLFFFVLGLFAYESVWIFPIAVLLICYFDRYDFKMNFKRDIIYTIIIWVVFIIYLGLRYSLINEVAGNYEASAFFNIDIIKLAGNLLKLIIRCFLPPLYSNTMVIWAGLLSILALVAMFRRSRSKASKRFLIIVSALLLISFFPYLSLGIDTHSVEGERYLYMPSIFAAILLVGLTSSISSRLTINIGLWTLLLFVNLFFLEKSRTHYSTASAISKATYQQINMLKGKKRLFIDSLPQIVNGALVFRLGFDDGAHWLKDKGTVDSIFIMSVKLNNANWESSYEVSSSKDYPISQHNKIFIKDSTQKQTYIQHAITFTPFNLETDAWFIFGDSTLKVIK